MNALVAAALRRMRGLRRPSKAANARRLRRRGQSLDSFVIRQATAADVPELARVHVAAWNATHGGPRGRRPTYELRLQQWTEKLGSAKGRFCYVAVDNRGAIVGFASGRWYDHPGPPRFEGQLDKIYLLPEYQRVGLGRRLFAAVARRLRERGMKSMLLFSQPENPSCAFFEALGGERLLDHSGAFHGGYGWRDLERLETLLRRTVETGQTP